jgi:ribonuclease R
MSTFEGIIRINSKGQGFVETKTGQSKDEQIKIEPTFLRTALHGDKVKIILHPYIPGQSLTGEVLEILERERTHFTGALENKGGIFVVVPSDRKIYTTIAIPKDKLKGAKVGDKVAASIDVWEHQRDLPVGHITHVLGRHGEHNAEIKAIALEQGFENTFPDAVEKEAKKIKDEFVIKNEISKRRDMRDTLTFTIDPADAKDFDDAISFKKLQNGNYEIGIHIADVSFFVRPGNMIDDEAYKRGTSVYLVDRTIPMLPEILSNDLCSLNPNEDKLAMSAIFEMNDEAEILNEWYGETIICSDRRFAYEEAWDVISKGKGDYVQELQKVNELSKILREERFKNGALMIDQEEVKFKLDKNGKPIDIFIKIHTDANHLIEEFMLLANRKVTEWVRKKIAKEKRVFVYRIHDVPNKEKMADLAFFLNGLGFRTKLVGGSIPSQILNGIFEKLQSGPTFDTVQTIVTRSMAKAIYSTKNIGHYGLQFKEYTHFTSPIRRYPDLMVHRLIKLYLSGKIVPIEKREEYDTACSHSSKQERVAQEAERASIKYKQVEYIGERLMTPLEGIITGVTEWGVYVEEKISRAEGLIHIRKLPGNDFYQLNEKTLTLSGRKSKKSYRIGDRVKIQATSTDLVKKMIDYEFI